MPEPANQVEPPSMVGVLSSSEQPLSPEATETLSGLHGRSSRVTLLLVVGIAALVLAPPYVLPGYWLFIATSLVIYAIAVMGLDVVFGRSGQLSLTQAAFVGIGAYSAAIYGRYTDPSLLVELAIAIAIASLMGIGLGLPAVRVSGLRLAILTFAFLELFQWFVVSNPDVAGGSRGLPVWPAEVFGYSLADPKTFFWVVSLIAIGGSVVLAQLSRTALGRSMLAIRESELAASSVGVAISRVKVVAFVISAIYGAVAGVLFAHNTFAISPPQFDVFASINLLVAVILGGAGRTLGAWLGAAYIVLAPELFAEAGFPNLYPLVSGVLLIFVMLAAPRGFVDVGRRARKYVIRQVPRLIGRDGRRG